MDEAAADAVARSRSKAAARKAGRWLWTVRVVPSGEYEVDVYLQALTYASRVPRMEHQEVTRVLRLTTGEITAEEAAELVDLAFSQLDL